MNYTIKDFRKGNILVTFENKKEILAFLNECDRQGIRWKSGHRATDVKKVLPSHDKTEVLDYILKRTIVYDIFGLGTRYVEDAHQGRCIKFSDFDFAKSDEEIHITRKGSEVHGILKKDGKVIRRSVAKCSPEDEFNFHTGAELAFNRLYGKSLHLQYLATKKMWGKIGEETPFVDVAGEKLYVGDVVEIYRDGKSNGMQFVCHKETGDHEYFVMSLADHNFTPGKDYEKKFDIIKRESYINIKEGFIIGSIEAVALYD